MRNTIGALVLAAILSLLFWAERDELRWHRLVSARDVSWKGLDVQIPKGFNAVQRGGKLYIARYASRRSGIENDLLVFSYHDSIEGAAAKLHGTLCRDFAADGCVELSTQSPESGLVCIEKTDGVDGRGKSELYAFCWIAPFPYLLEYAGARDNYEQFKAIGSRALELRGW
jgi:hypothetical protein